MSKKNTILSILFFVFHITFGQNQTSSPFFAYSDNYKNAIDSLVAMVRDQNHIPGVALIIVHEDSIIFSKGYGFSDLARQVKVNPSSTVFRCGSVSKSFTAAAVMILKEQGKIDLHKDISFYLAEEEINSFGISGKTITLHHLLTHSAGFDERLFGSHVRSYEEWMPLKEYFVRYPLIFRSEPGEILNYNDQGIALAGYIVEKVSGMSFSDFMKEEVFRPLQMNNSSFDPQLPKNIKENLAESYTIVDNEYQALDYDYILPYPAAGLVSTPQDLAKFMIMHLNEGGNLLSKNSIAIMQSRQFTNHPQLRGWCYGFAEWYENGYRMIFKDGQATGFNSRLLLMPEQKWGFYLVWNRSIFDKGGSINEANKLKSSITSLLLDEFFPETTDPELKAPNSFSLINHYQFEGRYIDMSVGTHDWSKLLTIALQNKVAKPDKDLWEIQGGRYIRIDTLLFQWHEGNEFYAAFSTDENRIKYLHMGTGSKEKVPFFEHATFQLVLLGMFHLLFLLITFSAFYKYKKKGEYVYLLTGIGSLISFTALPIFAIVLFSVDFQELYKGATTIMIIASWMPFLGGMLMLLSSIYNHYQKFILWLILAGLLYIPYLMYWNFPIL